jgi:hypothetical protein
MNDPRPLNAFDIGGLVVFAHNGCQAKELAAPEIRPNSEWRVDVSGWVALRAERRKDLDHLRAADATEAYIQRS